MRILLFLLLAVPCALAQPNIVMIVADDLGVDLVRKYREGASPPCTPNIDSIAQGGLLFRNAWSNPSCSPTRAQILTGLHAHKSGMGANIREDAEGVGILLPDATLPRSLNALGYETVALGKWHLSGKSQGLLHPNEAGYDYYAGSMFNLASEDPNSGYSDWIKNTQGVESHVTRYATRDTTRDAVAQLEEMQEPFFLYVAYNAPHAPLHWPSEQFCNRSCSFYFCSRLLGTLPGRTKAMVEALDDQVGRLLIAIYDRDPDAIVIFVGDNGTAATGAEPPFDNTRAKNTMYEGGINVPLLVKGPGIAAGETAALVSTVDLYATLLDLAGGQSGTPDSVSFVPVLIDPETIVRETVYAESFRENFNPAVETVPLSKFERAIRNDQFKLIRTLEDGVTTMELYNLQRDRWEDDNLYPPQTPFQLSHFQDLVQALIEQGVAPRGDVNSDGRVGLTDLATVLTGFGMSAPGFADGDTNFDGAIDLGDLMVVVESFGVRG